MERPTACGAGESAGSEIHAPMDHSLASAASPSFLLGPSAPVEVHATGALLQPRVSAGPSTSVRLLDVTVASLMLLLVLPLMAVCSLVVRLSGPGPVLFRQVRIGRDGRPFTCFKFRTMVVCAEAAIEQVLCASEASREEWAASQKIRCDPRVTRAGRYIRRYCLDELPQLFNVLRGEMSIVGPRPIVADEIHRYGANFSDYCSVNPGLTGLWQVSGLHALPYSDRVRLDAKYAASKSLRLDLLILWRTIPIVLFGQNESSVNCTIATERADLKRN